MQGARKSTGKIEFSPNGGGWPFCAVVFSPKLGQFCGRFKDRFLCVVVCDEKVIALCDLCGDREDQVSRTVEFFFPSDPGKSQQYVGKSFLWGWE